VFTDPVAGHEDEYNKWYNEQHQLDVVSIPGFVSAQRFVKDNPLYRYATIQLPQYLIVYKIVTDDLDKVFEEVSRRLQTGETRGSPYRDLKTEVDYVYRTFRPEITGVGGEPEGAKPGPKELYYHIVFTPFYEGREAEFNETYDKHHAPELAAIPGFISAQRMILARPANGNVLFPPTKYLALFKLQTSDLASVKELTKRPVTPTPAQNAELTRGYTFRAITPVVWGDKVRAERAAKSGHAAKSSD
jgi:hypothetical protein